MSGSEWDRYKWDMAKRVRGEQSVEDWGIERIERIGYIGIGTIRDTGKNR